MEYTRGSEWRRWDFHLHTPDTKKNDNFNACDDLDKWDVFYKDIIDYIGDKRDPQKTIAAIGITDYFSIENYKKVKADGKLNNIVDFIFPNIELRCLPLKDGIQMNIHLLINPDFIDKVETIVLSNLKYKRPDNEYCARKEDLIRFGKDLDPSIQDDDIAYKKGVENFHVNFDEIITLFKNHPECKENVLVAIPNSSVDGASAVANPSIDCDLQDLFEYRKDLYFTANFILSSKEKDSNFFLGKLDKKPAKIIPCIWGCDAHSNNRIFEPLDNNQEPTKRYCWIKADPTWEGLKQVLAEPEGRVKIQELCPNNRVDNYRIIDRITIEDDHIPHRFSNDTILLNPNLNCIIGLKSTGKSILLQNMARAILPNEVDTRLKTIYGDKNKRGINFPVTVYWKDGIISNVDNGNDKKIIYIPQSYLNKLMDDLAEKTEIDDIVENIIIQNKEYNLLHEAFIQQLMDIQKELDSLTIDLIYKKQVIDNKSEFIKDLGNIDSVQNNIKEFRKRKENLAKSLKISEKDIKEYDLAVSKNVDLISLMETIEKDKSYLQNISTIFSLKEDNNIVDDDVRKQVNDIYRKISEEANQKWHEDIKAVLSNIGIKISEIKKEIDSNKEIITRLKPRIESNQEINKIDEDLRKEEENLKNINTHKSYLDTLKNDYNKLIDKITNLTTVRETAYDCFVEKFKSLHFEDTNENFKIVAIKRRRRKFFADEFSNIFTQNALKTIHNGVFKDFSDSSLIIDCEYDESCKKDFIEAILYNNEKKVLLNKYDIERAIKEILKDYDNVIYTIEMDGDLIEAMSPGKKALVLLKLLISLDKTKYPILIDQPEDDLDNLSIVSDLVSFIKERKEDRQIILVTHNANLVLGCDAEEIIVANQEIQNNPISKNEKFQFEYRAGSIENINILNKNTFLGSKGIQSHICEILEGGKEAFNTRKNKYTNIKI